MGSLAGVRSRWAAIGAACAVALGAGGFGVVNAVVSSGEKSVFVPVSPIRVLDTRDNTEISNGTRRLVVEGAITVADGSSQLVVPSAASAVAVNITATSTRKNGGYGFVTVFVVELRERGGHRERVERDHVVERVDLFVRVRHGGSDRGRGRLLRRSRS